MLERHSKLLTLLLLGALSLSAQPAAAGALSPALEAQLSSLAQTAQDTSVDVVVFLYRQVSSATADVLKNPLAKRTERLHAVLKDLHLPQASQTAEVRRFLGKRAEGDVRYLPLGPVLSARIPAADLPQLASLPGVKLVVENAPMLFNGPVEVRDASSLAAGASDPLELLKVRALWAQGIKGKGRLVCSFDTGVQGDHPALASRWRGNHADLAACWFSKVSPNQGPIDNAGHGTHTMGIMVGATEADSFGVAPEAEWITAGVIDQGRPLNTTLMDIIEAFQWALDPDGNPATTDDVPDVISNSWGVPKGLFPPCDETFSDMIETVEAAGIVTIFAAGNEGPNPMTMRNPADMATTPLSAFAVGAVDLNGTIAAFSSRGPSSCDLAAIKPEVVAPGVSIRSSFKGSTYAYLGGTSQAAPFIAGLVALMRQYNPEATVEQIKSALLQATTDLGDLGEDNTYGNGLVDASRLLQYLPAPGTIEFQFVQYEMENEAVAWPGDTIALHVVLVSPTSSVTTVNGQLTSEAGSPITMLDDQAEFSFGAGAGLGVNQEPLLLVIDKGAQHGTSVPFELRLTLPGSAEVGAVDFALAIGVAPQGEIVSHLTDELEFSVSDFGQYGLGPGSIYNTGGYGFRFNGSDNLLYEAGVVVARNALQLSHSLRAQNGDYRVSDFRASQAMNQMHAAADGGLHSTVELNDRLSEIPIPVSVAQDVVTFDDAPGVVLFRYSLINASIEPLTSLRFGFAADFDLSQTGDSIGGDAEAGLLYQMGDGRMVGLVALEGLSPAQVLVNTPGKTGFSNSELYSMLSQVPAETDPDTTGDLMYLISSPEVALAPAQKFQIAFALVVGNDLEELRTNAALAQQKYDLATGVDYGNQASVPQAADLCQNYPNPFNPSTAIAFSLQRAGQVSLVVYNSLGQRVSDLYSGPLPAGLHTFWWHGTTDGGERVASGIYFYRLEFENSAQTKKMVLLK